MKKYLVILLLILLLGLALRVYPAIKSPGMFNEPDVYIYYSVAQQTLANHMHITSKLSGVPPVPYSEFPGLVLVPAYLSKYTGIPLSLIFEYLPVLMGLLGIIVVYLLMDDFMHQHWVSNLAAFIYAVIPAAIYRGMAGEWRGGVFVVVFVGIVLLFLIKTTNTAIWTIPGAILFTIISVWFWSGGVYILAILAIYLASALIFYLLPRFSRAVSNDPGLKNKLTYLLIFILLPIGFLIMIHIGYFKNLLSGYFNFKTSYIDELAPTSLSFIFWYYNWVFVAAIMGIALMIILDSKSYFHKSQFALFSLFVPTLIMVSIEVRWLSLFAIPASIYAAYLVYALLTIFKVPKHTSYLIIGFLCILLLLISIYFILPLVPSDDINPQFISALEWMRNNTPANSTVLTLWPDGSLVEGVAQRESYTDSIMSLGSPESLGIEKMLYEPAGNYSYLYHLDPSYLLVRKYWLNETDGILLQMGLPLNTSYNGTNMQQLLQINNTSPPPFKIVYQNNGTIIYKIKN